MENPIYLTSGKGKPNRWLACLTLAAALAGSHTLIVGQRAQSLRPALVVQTGHTNAVQAMAFHPSNPALLATASQDRSAKLWDLRGQRERAQLSGHTEIVQAVAFSPDGTQLATASSGIGGTNDFTLRLWDIENATETATIPIAHEPSIGAYGLIVDRDGRSAIVGTGGYNNHLARYDFKTGKTIIVSPLAHPNGIAAIAASVDVRVVATLDLAGIARVFDGETLLPSGVTIEIPGTRLTGIAVSADGLRLAAGDEKGGVHVCDTASGRLERDVTRHEAEVRALSFDEAGALATGGLDGLVRIIDSKSRNELFTARVPGQSVTALAFQRTGSLLAAADFAGTVRVWDVASRGEIFTSTAHGAAVLAAKFRPGTHQIVSSGPKRTISFWDLPSATKIREISMHGPEAIYRNKVAFSVNAPLMALADLQTIRMWHLDEATEQPPIATGEPVSAVALDPGGRFAASSDYKNSVTVWDLRTRAAVSRLSGAQRFGQAHSFDAIQFSSDGKWFAGASSDGTVRLWSTTDWRERMAWEGSQGYAHALAFCPDVACLAFSSGPDAVSIARLDGSSPFMRLAGHASIPTDLAFGSSSTLVSVASGQIASWKYQSGANQWRQSLAGVQTVSISSDGAYLATGTRDGRTVVLNTRDGRTVFAFIAVNATDYAVIADDGHYFATPAAARALGFTLGQRTFPFEAFDLELNRPDLILSRMPLASEALVRSYQVARRKRLVRLGLSADSPIAGDDSPNIEIVRTNLPFVSADRTFTVPLVSADRRREVLAQVWINDVPLFERAGKTLRRSTADGPWTIDVQLGVGMNRIQVAELNANAVEGIRDTVVVHYRPTRPQPPGRFVLATVGVAHYSDARFNLRYADKDAQDMAAFARTRGALVFDPVVNAAANRAGVLTLRQHFAKTDVDDLAVVFLAGHGVLDRNMDYYFGTTDLNFTSPADNGIPFDALERLFDGIPARRRLLLIDTCHAGELDRITSARTTGQSAAPAAGVSVKALPRSATVVDPDAGVTTDIVQRLFANLGRGNGAAVIAASGGADYAWERDGNGLFTHALLAGLAGSADSNADGSIRISELASYIGREVARLSGGGQTPSIRRENLAIDFEVMRLK